jgi:hypothetical protein
MRKQKWSDDDRRAFAENRLRAKTIPKRRLCDEEWEPEQESENDDQH